MGPKIYEELVRECYLISRYINTSYNDLLDTTPSERLLLLRNISEEAQNNQKRYEQDIANMTNSR